MILIVKKKWSKLEFYRNGIFYEIKFKNFSLKKKAADIRENFVNIGSVFYEKRFVFGDSQGYNVELKSIFFSVVKAKNIISTENLEFRFLPGRNFLVYRGSVKVGKVVYINNLSNSQIRVKLNSENLFYDFLVLFAALSCDRVSNSFTGNPMDR